MGSLPPGLAGSSNPYAPYLESLEATFYRTPSRGFKARLIVLACLDALHIALAILFFVLSAKPMLKRNGGSGIWVVRVIKRGPDRYLVSNPKLVGAVATMAWGAMGLAYIQNTKAIYVDRAPHGTATWFLRSAEWIPLYLGVYLTSASFVQAFLLASTQTKTKSFFTARNWNRVILGIFLAIVTSQLAFTIWSIIAGRQLWKGYLAIWEPLDDLARTWDGGPANYTALLELGGAPTAEFTRVATNWINATIVQYSTACVMPLSSLALTVCGLLLARQIRVQASAQIERFKEMALQEHIAKVEPKLPPPAMGRRGSYAEEARRGEVTTHTLRKLAVMKVPEGEELSDGLEQASLEAQKILEMLKAKNDLITNCTNVCLSSIMVLATSLFVAVVIGTGQFASANWAMSEATLFALPWEVAILITFMYIKLLHSEWVMMRLEWQRKRNISRGSRSTSGAAESDHSGSLSDGTGERTLYR